MIHTQNKGNKKFVKTNVPGFRKNPKSNIVINTNRAELLAYNQSKEKIKQFQALTNKLKEQNTKIEKLEAILNQLLERQECLSN